MSTGNSVLAVVVAVGLVACFNTSGMEADLGETAADELSSGEASDVCTSLDAQLDRLNKPGTTCYGEALAQTDDEEICDQLYDICIERSDPLRPTVSGCTAAGVQSCADRTVGEIIGCYTDLADFVSNLNCQTRQIDTDAAATDCARELANDCPGIFTTRNQ